MLAPLLILIVMLAVGLSLNPSREQFAWFMRLRRPAWLGFERWIPLIWISIYGCFYGSALLSSNAGGGWLLMAAYLVLLLLVQGYTWLICRSRSLANGTLIGLAGWLWGMALAAVAGGASRPAAILLIPFLIWSPVGTLVTWQMQRLNR